MKYIKDKNNSLMSKFLNFVEKTGNALPHPVTLFVILAVLVVLFSALTSYMGLEVIHPGTKAIVKPMNLLSLAGLHKLLQSMVVNFTSFAPLGTVLVAMLGIGIAEGTGLIGAVLKLIVTAAPRSFLTFAIVFAGVISNTASEVGYVLLIPLAGIAFKSVGRNPMAGIAAAFAAVSGGYSANILLGTVDPLLAGLSTEAARIIDINYLVSPAANYYFMCASTFLVTIVVTIITEKIIVPRFGEYKEDPENKEDNKEYDMNHLSKEEKRGLIFATIGFLIVAIVLLLGTVPVDGFLRNPSTGSLLNSPFMSGIVAMIFIIAMFTGILYGFGAGTIGSDSDVVKGMSKTMSTLGAYIVLVFFAAQFIALFNWSNMGLMIAVKGADFLKYLGLGQIPLIIGLIIFSSFINLFMGSASAKWAILAPIFVPMFMLLGYTPELTQTAYRVGDSVTNIISPCMSYFAFIVCIMQSYQKKAGIGTLVATMLPYSIVLMITWTIFLVIWMMLGLNVGPGSGLFL